MNDQLSQDQLQAMMEANPMNHQQASTALGSSNNIISNAIGGWQKYTNVLGDISTGVAKGELSTLKGASDIGKNVAQHLTQPFIGDAALQTQQEQQFNKQVDTALTPQGVPEKIGYTAEKIGEFIAPTGKIKGIEAAIDASKTLPTMAKIGAKALTEASTGAGISYAQTEDPRQAGISALTFGLTKGITGTLGAGAKAIGIPEHLYSTVFKNTANDMLNELKTGGIATLQKENPTLFKQFVDSGLIKTAKDGSFQVDETLARQALNRGLRGSIQNMANAVVKSTLQNEHDAQQIAKKTTQKVSIPGFNKLSSVLKTVATDYENVGQGEISSKASNFANILESSKGELDAKTALKMRRFLDGMRSRSSYNPQVKLSTTGENFKYWSNVVRKGVNQIPGMEKVMKDYSFNIDALNSLAKTAAQRGNQQLVNMLDVLIFEGGMTGMEPGIGAGMSIGRKILTTPAGATHLGSAIERSGTLTKKGSMLKGILSRFIGDASSQEPQ